MSLAGFSAAFSITIIFSGIILSNLKIYNSHLADKAAFNRINRFYLILSILFVLISLTIGATWIGNFVFITLLHLKPEAALYAKSWMIWSSPVQVLIALRSGSQSIALVYKHPKIPAMGTGIRLSVLVIAQFFLLTVIPSRPVLACALALCSATLVEYFFLLQKTHNLLNTPSPITNLDRPITWTYLLSFSAPLWISSIAWTSSFALITFFVSFSSQPEIGVGCFGLLRSLTVWACSPLYAISTLVVILGKQKNMQQLRYFSLGLSTLIVLAVIISTATNLHYYIFSRIFNLADTNLNWAMNAYFLLIPIPIMLGIRCFQEGRLIKRKISSHIGTAGCLRLITIAFLGVLTMYWGKVSNGAILGMLLMVFASFTDAAYLTYAIKRK